MLADTRFLIRVWIVRLSIAIPAKKGRREKETPAGYSPI